MTVGTFRGMLLTYLHLLLLLLLLTHLLLLLLLILLLHLHILHILLLARRCHSFAVRPVQRSFKEVRTLPMV